MAPTIQGLRIRKLADKSEGERIVRFDPETGEKKLVNPHTAGDDHEPWPLAGVQIEGDTPKLTRVPTSFVASGRAEGWIELENDRPVHRPGGTPDDPWMKTHTFIHADAVILKTVDGDVRFEVVHQPDKYDDESGEPTEEAGDPTTHVDWFYDLKLEG